MKVRSITKKRSTGAADGSALMSTLSELEKLQSSMQARVLAEERARKEEKERTELELVKRAVVQNTEEERQLNELIVQQQEARADLLKVDGPPGEGFFVFNYPQTSSASPSSPRTKVPHESLLNGSFRTSIGQETSKVSSGQLSYLHEQIWLGDTEELSTACFDTFASLLTGDNASFFSSRASIPVPRSSGKAALIEPEWKLHAASLEQIMLAGYLNKSGTSRWNARRGLRLIELVAKLALVDDPKEVLVLVLTLACFPQSELLEPEIRSCAAALSSCLRDDNDEFGAVGSRIADVCLARIAGSPVMATSSITDSARDECLLRAVRLGGLLSTTSSAQHVFVETLRSLVKSKVFHAEAEDVEVDDITLHDGSTRSLIFQMLQFASRDLDRAHAKARQDPLQPFHFHRWQSAIRLVQLASGQVEEKLVAGTMRRVFRELHELQSRTDRTFLLSGAHMLDTLRFVKRQCEPYVHSKFDPSITSFLEEKKKSRFVDDE